MTTSTRTTPPTTVPPTTAPPTTVRPLTVAQVMLRRPGAMPPTATLGDARARFANDHVHMLLLVDGPGHLVGTVVREDLPTQGPSSTPVRRWSVLDGRTVEAERDAGAVLEQMTRAGLRRLAVVDQHGRLTGLLCRKRSGTGFCSDTDVAARARNRT